MSHEPKNGWRPQAADGHAGLRMEVTASAAQLRFYLLRAQGADTVLTHHLVIDGTVDADRIRNAWAAVVTAQPALRTSLHPFSDGLRQRRHPASATVITVHRRAVSDLPAEIAAMRHDFGGDEPWCRIAAYVGPDRTDCLITIDHALFDEPSIGILLHDLARAYAGEVLPAPRVDAAAGPGPARGDKLREFWAETLDGCPPDTSIPQLTPTTDRRRATLSRALDDHLAAAIEARTRGTGATPFTQLLAAVAIVTGWYAEQDDVVLAAVADVRGAADREALGCWQNTLPIRIDLTDAGPDEVLDRTLDALYDGIEHADLPLEEIVELRGVARSPERKPLTQIICVQTTAAPSLTTPDGSTWRAGTPTGAGNDYGLAVTLELSGATPTIRLDHAAAGLPGAWAEAFTSHLLRALAWLTRLHDDQDLLAPDEGVLTGPPLDGPVTGVPQRFARWARDRPSAVAVDDGRVRLTYAELDRKVDALAGALIAAGVRPDDRVGICLPRTAAMVAAMLAVWRAGAAYVPLDPEYPDERLRYMADDAVLTAVIADRNLISGVTTIPAEPAPAPALAVPARRPHATAYIIYTSGSTGAPKGAVIRHDNLSALVVAFETLLPDAPETIVAATSLSFDMSVLELCWPLATGRTVLLTSHRRVARTEVPDGALYQCTPTVARLLADDQEGVRLLERLGVLIVGGEPLPEDLARELLDRVPGQVISGYGPTETTVFSTAWRVRPGEPIRIGTPLTGEICWVADSRGRRRPPGSPGRLMIAGAGVGGGYWRRPELTGERFRDGYDSGDIAVLDADNQLRCLGRADTQVKLLGQRIELEEIEVAIRRDPRVRDAVVTVLDGVLIAFVVVGDGPGEPAELDPDTAGELRRHVAGWLTPVMIPSVWARMDAVPQTPNRKQDRAAVARLATELSLRRATPAAPADTGGNEVEALVADVWSQVLGTPATGLDTTFFELGGSSAALIQVLALLRPRYPDLSAADLFRYTTVRALAGHLDDRPVVTTDDPRPDDRAAARRRALSGWGPRGRKGTAR